MNYKEPGFTKAIGLRCGELASRSGRSCVDRVGIGLSLLCLVHCLLLPFAVVLMPALELFPVIENSGHEETVHAALLFFIIPAAYLGWLSGYRRHGNFSVIATGMVGLVLLLLAFQFTDSRIHVALTSIGGLMIMFAHFVNLRVWRSC